MREYPAYPLPAVLAMVVKDGRVLLAQRDREPDRGKWGFPGGLIECGETVAAAVLRELMEETGLTAEAGPVMEVLDLITRDESGRVRFHYVVAAVRCTWLAGEAVPGSDAARLGWFTPEEIARLPVSKNLPRLVAMLFSGSRA
jgi:ADP-ribose pyrophosphatase YjhB (NUDIX family)